MTAPGYGTGTMGYPGQRTGPNAGFQQQADAAQGAQQRSAYLEQTLQQMEQQLATYQQGRDMEYEQARQGLAAWQAAQQDALAAKEQELRAFAAHVQGNRNLAPQMPGVMPAASYTAPQQADAAATPQQPLPRAPWEQGGPTMNGLPRFAEGGKVLPRFDDGGTMQFDPGVGGRRLGVWRNAQGVWVVDLTTRQSLAGPYQTEAQANAALSSIANGGGGEQLGPPAPPAPTVRTNLAAPAGGMPQSPINPATNRPRQAPAPATTAARPSPVAASAPASRPQTGGAGGSAPVSAASAPATPAAPPLPPIPGAPGLGAANTHQYQHGNYTVVQFGDASNNPFHAVYGADGALVGVFRDDDPASPANQEAGSAGGASSGPPMPPTVPGPQRPDVEGTNTFEQNGWTVVQHGQGYHSVYDRNGGFVGTFADNNPLSPIGQSGATPTQSAASVGPPMPPSMPGPQRSGAAGTNTFEQNGWTVVQHDGGFHSVYDLNGGYVGTFADDNALSPIGQRGATRPGMRASATGGNFEGGTSATSGGQAGPPMPPSASQPPQMDPGYLAAVKAFEEQKKKEREEQERQTSTQEAMRGERGGFTPRYEGGGKTKKQPWEDENAPWMGMNPLERLAWMQVHGPAAGFLPGAAVPQYQKTFASGGVYEYDPGDGGGGGPPPYQGLPHGDHTEEYLGRKWRWIANDRRWVPAFASGGQMEYDPGDGGGGGPPPYQGLPHGDHTEVYLGKQWRWLANERRWVPAFAHGGMMSHGPPMPPGMGTEANGNGVVEPGAIVGEERTEILIKPRAIANGDVTFAARPMGVEPPGGTIVIPMPSEKMERLVENTMQEEPGVPAYKGGGKTGKWMAAPAGPPMPPTRKKPVAKGGKK